MNINSATLALSLLPQSSGSINFSSLYAGLSSGAGAVNAGTVALSLRQAEANEAKQLEVAAKDPVVQRDIERYKRVVKDATTVEEVLDDPVARRVFLTANGLGDQADYVALAKRGVLSDPNDENSLAVRMSESNNKWLQVAQKYNLQLVGVGALQVSDAIAEVTENYIAEKRLDNLDQQMPGLGTALLFKKAAGGYTSALNILGSGLAREVVTTALGIPKQIAYQSIKAQEKAINTRMNVEDLQDERYVDRLVQRYLLEVNGIGLSGISV